MSHTSIYTFDADSDLCHGAHFHNAWRSAPMLWDYLVAKYDLAVGSDARTGPQTWGALWGMDPNRSFWDESPLSEAEELARQARARAVEARLLDHEWWALMTTCDRVVITKECVGELVAALRKVGDEITAYTIGKYGQCKQPSSFGEQADFLERCAKQPWFATMRGFAWNQTSISTTWPMVPCYLYDPDAYPEPEDGDYGDDCAPPRLDRDGGYVLIPGLRQEQPVKAKHVGAATA